MSRELEVELRGAVGRLSDAIESEAMPPEVLLCGAAGTGKTWGVLFLLHLLSLRRPNLRILLCRKTRESMSESVLVTYEQEVLPFTGHGSIAEGIKRRVRQVYTYPNGTEWVVGGLDKPTKILSTSYDLAYPNEAIELDIQDWETLQSRIGRPDRSHGLNALIGDTNPGDASHWLKQRCDAKQCELWTSYHEDNPALYDATRREWLAAGTAFLARLGRLTGSRRLRFLKGIWAAPEGVWFDGFTEKHVDVRAEYDARYPVHLSIDSGVHSGAVWFQVKPVSWPVGVFETICVFGDFYAFNQPAFQVGLDVIARTNELCNGRVDVMKTDPAGKSATAIGPTVYEEYRRAGLKRLEGWPIRPVMDGLALVESFVSVKPPQLLIHPRCTHLQTAFANYKRAMRQKQWIDRPEDPCHPYEDLMDALRGGLVDKFPEGRKVPTVMNRTNARNIF